MRSYREERWRKIRKGRASWSILGLREFKRTKKFTLSNLLSSRFNLFEILFSH